MRKNILFVVVVIFTCFAAFSQKRIGTVLEKNIVFVTVQGEKLVYIYYDYDKLNNRRFFLNYGNELFGPYQFVAFDKSSFDEKHTAFLLKKDEGSLIFFDGKEYGPYGFDILQVEFLGDGSLVYKVQKNKKDYVCVDGNEVGPLDDCSKIVVSSDRRHYAYSYERNRTNFLVKDGKIVGTYKALLFHNFIPNTDDFCVIESSLDDSVNLHFGKKTYQGISAETVNLYEDCIKNSGNSIMYLADAEQRHCWDVCVNGKVIRKRIMGVYPSPTDIYDYAYTGSKRIEKQNNSYYGSFDSENEEVFNADCLFYKDREYLLKGRLVGVFLLNEREILYATKNEDASISFYLNGKEIQKSNAHFYDGKIYVVKHECDAACFYIPNEAFGEVKVYYAGRIYTGTATDRQIVYVDSGVVYMVNNIK